MIRCHRRYVQRFIDGVVIYVAPIQTHHDLLELNAEQTIMFQEIVTQYVALQSDENCESAYRIRGEAGTGKSRVLDEFLHRSTLPQDQRDPPLFTVSNVLISTRTGVLSDVYRRSWRQHDNVVVDTFDSAFDTLQQFDTTAYCLAQFDAWVIDEVDYLTPSQWRRLIDLHQACPRVFKLLAGDEAQFEPIGHDGGHAAAGMSCIQKRLHTQMRFNPGSRFGRLCSTVRIRKPSARDIDFLVEGQLLQNAVDQDITMEGVRRFADRHPKGLAVAIQVETVQKINSIMVATFFEGQQALGDIVVDIKGSTRRITLFPAMRVMVTRNQDKSRGVVNGAFGIVRDYVWDTRVRRRDHLYWFFRPSTAFFCPAGNHGASRRWRTLQAQA